MTPPSLILPPDEIHVWTARLDLPPTQLTRLHRTLAPDEQARADRFRFARDRVRYLAGRGQLRALLSRYLALKPAQISFVYGPQGKPALSPSQNPARLQFNLAHSHHLALYALVKEREIGVDLEYLRPLPDADQIAARFFAPAEQAALRQLPPERRLEAFYTGWTRKEAYLKAHGAGLTLPLDQFEVSLVPGQPARLLRPAPDPTAATRWTLYDLDIDAGYLAALAVAGPRLRLVQRTWPE